MNEKTPIAVVGMAGAFPGALTLERYWQNIVDRKDAVSEIPEDRWNIVPLVALLGMAWDHGISNVIQ